MYSDLKEYIVLLIKLIKENYWLSCAALLLVCFLSYNFKSSPLPEKPSPLVKTAQVIKEDRVNQLHLIGTVVAPESVAVKSRLDSQIVKIYIQNGQTLKKGDKLIQLDDRVLKAQLAQAQANLESNKAEIIRSEKKYHRDTELAKRGVAAKETLDQSTQAYRAAKSAFEATHAQISNLETQIDYADIRSPIDGVAGNILITEGNLVKANDTNAIVVINRTNPINVDIPLPQRYFETVQSQSQSIPISIKASDTGSAKKTKGVILNNAVDTTARTLSLRAEFDNENRALWPGMFVDVIVDLKTYKDVLIVPLKAIMHTQNNEQVLFVSQDQVAHLKPVSILFTTETEAIVEADLKSGDQVIVDGGFNVKPETKISLVKDSAQ